MAEICCGDSSSSAPTSRRRRMETGGFKILTGVAPQGNPADDVKKRQKLEAYTTSFSRDCDSAAENRENNAKEKLQLVVELKNGGEVKTGEIMVSSQSLNLSLCPAVLSSSVGSLEFSPEYGVASVCGRRRDMEDAVAIHPSFCREHHANPDELHYFGVYDGHGCSHVATRCRERLHELVKEEVEGQEAPNTEWKAAMKKSFSRMDKEVNEGVVGVMAAANCRCEMQTPECDAVGSTAVVSILTPQNIIVANCGDSRAVLCRNGMPIPLSSDHKPDRPDELNRIEAAGGRVIYWGGPRVLGVLAMSRALGDNYLKPYVSCEPEVSVTERTAEDECLILASDGLWDMVSNETACGVARMCLRGKGRSSQAGDEAGATESGRAGMTSEKGCSKASMVLTKLALARQSCDNVSVVVVDLRRKTRSH